MRIAATAAGAGAQPIVPYNLEDSELRSELEGMSDRSTMNYGTAHHAAA
jgi:hypothetical protein